MIDAVLSYHLNPLTCGVAKFNQQLARRLNVPLESLTALSAKSYTYPLLSIKPSEINPAWLYAWAHVPPYVLFLHDWTDQAAMLIRAARHVVAANAVIAGLVRAVRPDAVTTAFCPATVEGNAHRGAYRVLTFGMAHKLVLPHFERLKWQLDFEHPDYTISLSTAVHEGSPWDTGLQESTAAMRAIFGDKLRVLGFLADDALAKELQGCDAVAAYFTPALRANNTSAWAALEAGKKLYTNTDEHSPPLDVTAHSWEKLVEILRAT